MVVIIESDSGVKVTRQKQSILNSIGKLQFASKEQNKSVRLLHSRNEIKYKNVLLN
jgi:hypothetical protein